MIPTLRAHRASFAPPTPRGMRNVNLPLIVSTGKKELTAPPPADDEDYATEQRQRRGTGRRIELGSEVSPASPIAPALGVVSVVLRAADAGHPNDQHAGGEQPQKPLAFLPHVWTSRRLC